MGAVNPDRQSTPWVGFDMTAFLPIKRPAWTNRRLRFATKTGSGRIAFSPATGHLALEATEGAPGLRKTVVEYGEWVFSR